METAERENLVKRIYQFPKIWAKSEIFDFPRYYGPMLDTCSQPVLITKSYPSWHKIPPHIFARHNDVNDITKSASLTLWKHATPESPVRILS